MINLSEPPSPHRDPYGMSETPLSHSQPSRSDWLHEIRAFEADRRTKYQSNLESLTVYWKSHCDILDTSVHETSRAYRLVLGVSKAHERMATTLGKGLSSLESESAPNETQQQLNSLEEANATMVQHFADSAATMKTNDVTTTLCNLLQTIQATQTQISKDGKQILKVLKRQEAQVELAWDAFFEASGGSSGNVPKSPAGETASVPVDSAPVDSLDSPSKSKSPLAGLTRFTSSGDPWLAEFQYRTCLASLEQMWEAKRTEFNTLFSTVQEAECMRRINLRESMIVFVRQQQNPFIDVEDTQAVVLTDWVEKETSQKEVQENVQVAIQGQMEALSASTASMNLASPADVSPTTDRWDEMAVYQRTFTPVSPLESDYLVNAFVVEQRRQPGEVKPGDLDGQKIMLAVVTADSFLHLFELACELSATPEEAFQALLPMEDPPLIGETVVGSLAVWNGRLKPSRTVDLDHCSVAPIREHTIVEIFETTNTLGSVNKIRLALSSPEERSAFVTTIEKGPTAGANA